MRWTAAVVITLVGLTGCTRTAPPPDYCDCPIGLVCCPGSEQCVVPGSGEGCPNPNPNPPPDMAYSQPDFSGPQPDFSWPHHPQPDLAPSPDMTPTTGPFSFSPPTVTFTNAIIGRDQPQVTVNISNPDFAFIRQVQIATATNSDELSITFDDCSNTNNSSCEVIVRFSPTRAGAVTSAINIVVGTDVVASCPITGSAAAGVPQLAVGTTTLDFGDVHVKAVSAPLALSVTNNGTGATTNLAETFNPLSAPFLFDSNFHWDACTAVLSPGNSCNLYLVFNPSLEGPVSTMMTVADGSVVSPAVTLKGRGVNPASLQVTASGPFANQWLGAHSDDVTFHVSNGGGDPTSALTTSITGDASGDFNITSDGCKGQMLPGGSSCDIKVQFAPVARGNRAAMLNVGGIATPLQGLGLVPATLTLTSGSGTITTDNPAIGWTNLTVRNDGDGATAPLTISFAGTSSNVFSLSTAGNCFNAVLAAGASCTFQVGFIPQHQGHWTDSVTVSAPNSTPAVTPLLIPLDGTFASKDTLRGGPAVLRFGTLNTVGWNFLTIWNTTAQPIGPLTLAVSGDSNFSILDGSACAGQTLAAGQFCKIKVEYTPTFSGSFKGTLTASADAGSVSVPLTASSQLPAFKFDPPKADFGTVAIGVVPPITVTVTNVSNRPAPTTYTVSDPNFWVTSSCPATLPPAPANNSCTISVGFGPRAAGTFNATVKFTAADAVPTLPLVGIAQ